MESLTKENFWNEMEQKYPKAMAHFKEWIDRYKSEHDWDTLFNGSIEGYEYGCSIPGSDIYFKTVAPKYHELPVAMQFGIFLEYLNYLLFNKLYGVQSVGIGNPKATVQTHLRKLEEYL